MDDGLRSSISPPLRNKFNSSHTPPARSNSTPPGRNMYNEMDRQTEMMMNQFGNFGLNEEVILYIIIFSEIGDDSYIFL
jgi:hypothetical protein